MDQRDQDHARHLAREGDDTVIFMILSPAKCDQCNQHIPESGFLTLVDRRPLCLNCAGLADLVFLPSGDPAVTRRAGKHSARKAIVIRWSRAGKRYQRQELSSNPPPSNAPAPNLPPMRLSAKRRTRKPPPNARS